MKSNYLSELRTRRNFIRQAACAAVGTVAMSNVLRDMRLINAAVAQTGIADYKALVCVFLNGGNDANNMIIPTVASEWLNYSTVRTPALAIPNTDGSLTTALALKTAPAGGNYTDPDGHTFGFHPAMRDISTLFNAGKVAPLFNVGTLSYPLTKAQYMGSAVPKPPQLFSHSDQQTQWQTSIPDQPQTSGWGGRIADLFTNASPNVNLGGQISMAVTLAGSNIFQVGNNNAAPQYSVTTGGAVQLSGVAGTRLTAMNAIVGTVPPGATGDTASPDLQTAAYANVLNHAIAESVTVNTALANNAAASYLTRFPSSVVTPNGGATFGSSLMAQMKMVARLIDIGKNQLGMKRQIFFIQVGGYDTHTVQTGNAGQTTTNNATVIIGQQANLLAELSQTLNALYLAMGDLGMANNVTAFTVSDFARTFPSNGSGSDHGWGGHHLVVGGAVHGNVTYGKFPTLAVNGPDDTGTGRWIPTTSVDQYAATLASWFGVDATNIPLIFPNLNRFASSNLNFI